MNILVACDSFKGCLSSQEIATTIARVLPQHNVRPIVTSDGGEGFCQAVSHAQGGEWHYCQSVDPLGREMNGAPYLMDGDTAYIELAVCSGLTLLREEERNPLKTSTRGTGRQVVDAIQRGARHIVLGIGGSATNDCGLGILSELGFAFGGRGSCGADLSSISCIDASNAHPLLKECQFTLASDVRSPLCGPDGATHTFARQKGATDSDIELLERGCQHFSNLLLEYTGQDIAATPGTGAAGGVGAGLMGCLSAKMKPGIAVLLQLQDFEHMLDDIDLVITGEGHIDRQTLMGKAPLGIAIRTKAHRKPCIALAGKVSLDETAPWDALIQVTPSDQPLAEAMRPDVAKRNIESALLHYLAEKR